MAASESTPQRGFPGCHSPTVTLPVNRGFQGGGAPLRINVRTRNPDSSWCFDDKWNTKCDVCRVCRVQLPVSHTKIQNPVKIKSARKDSFYPAHPAHHCNLKHWARPEPRPVSVGGGGEASSALGPAPASILRRVSALRRAARRLPHPGSRSRRWRYCFWGCLAHRDRGYLECTR